MEAKAFKGVTVPLNEFVQLQLHLKQHLKGVHSL